MKHTLPKEIETRLGITDFPQAAKDDVLAKVGKRVFMAIIDRTIDSFSPEVLEDFTVLVNGNPNAEALHGFLKTHVPNFDALLKEELAKVEKDLNKSES